MIEFKSITPFIQNSVKSELKIHMDAAGFYFNILDYEHYVTLYGKELGIAVCEYIIEEIEYSYGRI